MKKLMMMLGAMALCASVQAASANWSFSATGNTYGGYTIYVTTLGGTFDSLDAVKAAVLGGDVAKASGVTVATTRSSAATGTIEGLLATTPYDYYWVAVKGDDYWVSAKNAVTTGTDDAGAATIAFSAADGKDLLSGTKTGTFGSIPEPTSGLLLLLGVAGLALKRKHA